MSIPPLPANLDDTQTHHIANTLHSFSIHLLRRAREADKQSGLSPERLSVLSVLAYGGPQSVKALSQIESVSPPAISRIIGSLETLGLVKRTRSKTDARAVVIEATAKGKKLMEQGRARRLKVIANEIEQLNGKDRTILSRIASVLEKLEP